jgi:DNA-binding HxlR family transcriptional regulator
MVNGQLCPRFHRAIELIGGRWTGPIVQILLSGSARFATLRDSIPHISDRMLSERLHALEAEGIVTRTVIPESPIRVEYALSRKGQELQASLEAVARWAEKWIPLPDDETAARQEPGRKRRPVKTGRSRRTPGRRTRATG